MLNVNFGFVSNILMTIYKTIVASEYYTEWRVRQLGIKTVFEFQCFFSLAG